MQWTRGRIKAWLPRLLSLGRQTGDPAITVQCANDLSNREIQVNDNGENGSVNLASNNSLGLNLEA